MRYRFIDRLCEIDASGEGTLTLVKTFARSEDFFTGSFHTPDEVPSSLVLETLASAGSFLLTVRSAYRALALLIKVNHAAFGRSVLAGDRLTVRARLLGMQGDWGENGGPVRAGSLARASVRCLVDDTPAAEADLLLLCVPMAQVAGPNLERTITGYLDLVGLADARP